MRTVQMSSQPEIPTSRATTASGRERARLPASAATTRTAAAVTAVPAGSRPEAIGRHFLSGWSRSFSRSAASLTRYTEPESVQNTANAPSAGHTEGVKSFWAKTSPAKTKRFLTHCRGRRETRIDVSTNPLQADEVGRARHVLRRVPGVEDEPGPTDDGGLVVPGVGRQNNDGVVGGDVSGPGDGVETDAVDRHRRHEGVVVRDEGALARQEIDDLERGRIARVGHVGLVSDAQREDAGIAYRAADVVEGVGHHLHDVGRHLGVDLVGERDEARLVPAQPHLPGKVVGIGGQAVTTEAGSRIERHEPERLGSGAAD